MFTVHLHDANTAKSIDTELEFGAESFLVDEQNDCHKNKSESQSQTQTASGKNSKVLTLRHHVTLIAE